MAATASNAQVFHSPALRAEAVRGVCATDEKRSCSIRRQASLARVIAEPDPAAWDQDEILTLAEAATLAWPVTLSPRILRDAVGKGRLPCITIAGRLHFTPGDVARFIGSLDSPAARGSGSPPRTCTTVVETCASGEEGGGRRETAAVRGDTPKEPRRKTGGAVAQRRAPAWQRVGTPRNRKDVTMSLISSTGPLADNKVAADPMSLAFSHGLISAAIKVALANGGAGIRPRLYEARERAHGGFALFIDRQYSGTLDTRKREEAEQLAMLRMLTDAADQLGIAEPRLATAERAFEYLIPVKEAQSKHGARMSRYSFKVLAPHIKGKRLFELDETWRLNVEKKLRKKYAAATVRQFFTYLRMAIRAWYKKVGAAPVVSFSVPPAPSRSARLVMGPEFELIERYCDGEETYDPKAKTWSKPIGKGGRARAQNRHRRRMVGRLFRLACATGSRGGRLIQLAWGPNRRFPYVDLATGRLHRVPLGQVAARNKRAPTVQLAPGILALLKRWREEDGPDARFVIRTWEGRPYSGGCSALFRPVTRSLGIQGLPFHRTRHTVITAMVRAGVPLPVISAQCGISIAILESCYDHSPAEALQPLGHDMLDRILAGDIPRDFDDGWLDDEDWKFRPID